MNVLKVLIALWLVFGASLVTRTGAALPPTDCSTPRNAADSVFAWQQAESTSLEFAARCLDPAGRSPGELRDVAKRIKTVFDAKLAYVVKDEISDDPEYRNADGQHEVVVHRTIHDVVIARMASGDWLWTKSSLDRIDELYGEVKADTEWLDRYTARLPPSMRLELFGVQTWQYIALLLAFVLGLILRKVIGFVVENRVRRLVETLGQTWATKVVDVFASPGATLVMAAVLRFAYPAVGLPLSAARVMDVAVRVLVVLSLVWAAYRVVDVIAARMDQRAAETESKLDDQLVPLVRRALKVVTVIIGGLFVLQNLNVNVTSLLAGLGIGGLAFALAAKDTIANFFGSVMIFVDRPFQIGDWVATAGAEGVVEEVGFRSTRIRTFHNSLLTIPNAKIMDATIDNYGRRKYRRCFTTLGVTYDTTPEQMQAFVEGIRAIISANPRTRKDAYEVHMSGFGDSSLNVMLYFFIEVDSWTEELRQRHNIYLEIMRLAERIGVDFAFPTRTLHLAEVAQPGAPRDVASALPNEQLVETVDGFGPDGAHGRPDGPKLTAGYWPSARANRES